MEHARHSLSNNERTISAVISLEWDKLNSATCRCCAKVASTKRFAFTSVLEHLIEADMMPCKPEAECLHAMLRANRPLECIIFSDATIRKMSCRGCGRWMRRLAAPERDSMRGR
jgi:hypothetical protein